MNKPPPKTAFAGILLIVCLCVCGTRREEAVYFDVAAPDLSGKRLTIDRRDKLNPEYILVGESLFLCAGTQVSLLFAIRLPPSAVKKHQWELDQAFSDRPDLLALMPDRTNPMYGIKWLIDKDL